MTVLLSLPIPAVDTPLAAFFSVGGNLSGAKVCCSLIATNGVGNASALSPLRCTNGATWNWQDLWSDYVSVPPGDAIVAQCDLDPGTSLARIEVYWRTRAP
jgi:hypothetical protein